MSEWPAPADDGAADHLPGCSLTGVCLRSTGGGEVDLSGTARRTVVFVFPGIGGPGDDALLAEWTAVPGARGCTPEACAFRDESARFDAAGVDLLGLSAQSLGELRVAAEELALPFPLLSDPDLRLAESLGLPTFEFHGRRYYRRATLVVEDGTIEAALYPVHPPDAAAGQALDWLRQAGAKRAK